MATCKYAIFSKQTQIKLVKLNKPETEVLKPLCSAWLRISF